MKYQKATVGDKEYQLGFDNWALHQYGELCGLETLQETLNTFAEFAQISEGGSMTLTQGRNLGKLVFVAMESGGNEVTEREVLNMVFEYPELVQAAITVALDALPKPREEDKKKVEAVK